MDWDTFVMNNSGTQKEAVGRTYQVRRSHRPELPVSNLTSKYLLSQKPRLPEAARGARVRSGWRCSGSVGLGHPHDGILTIPGHLLQCSCAELMLFDRIAPLTRADPPE